MLLVIVMIVLAAGLAVSEYWFTLRDGLRRSDVRHGKRLSRRMAA